MPTGVYDRPSPTDRFWARVDKSGECWLWTAYRRSDGYGQFRIGVRVVRAHRYAYELLVGPIPEGLILDHLCRVRNCVNPAHLEPVTQGENVRRGLAGGPAAGLRMRAKTHCLQGHPYDEENTRWYKGWRYCRTCQHLRDRSRSYSQTPV